MPVTTLVPGRLAGSPRGLFVRKVGMPLAILILLAIVAALLTALPAVLGPRMFTLAVVPTTAAFALGTAALLWLDRWEPEPRRLLVFAALWGASVAVLLAPALEVAFASHDVIETAVAAPVFEEFAKGTLLIIMVTGRRGREMSTLVDHLVYAGLCGLGFAYSENLMYLSGASDLGDLWQMIVVRLGLKVWGHPLYAMVLALGVYLARQPGPWWSRILAIPAGFVGATTLHGIWNGSLFFHLWVTVAVYLGALLPALGLLVWSGVQQRRREGVLVAGELPRLVAAGYLGPALAGTLAALPVRRSVLGGLPKAVQPAYRELADAVAELAFLNERIEQVGTDPRLAGLRQELLARIGTARTVLPPG